MAEKSYDVVSAIGHVENAYREVTKRAQDLARDKADQTWLNMVQDRLDEVWLLKHTIQNS